MDPESNLDKSQGDPATATKLHVEKVIQKAHEELSELLRQRAALTSRIGTVNQTIVGLIKLFGEEILSDDLKLMGHRAYRKGAGVTDSCRRVLMEAGGAVSAREVRDAIQKTNPQALAKHKDPLATVTTVMGRLAEYGEAQAAVSAEGRRVWRWSVETDPISDQDSSAPETSQKRELEERKL
jgi:hypothetical protein